jgi:hypothetical protein
VTDLAPSDIVMSEKGVPNEIVKVEPFHLPVRLTLAVDNGPLSGEALAHYRTGLTGLVKALPPEVEITLITTAPQPRMVVRPTTNREQLFRGINGFAPESESPRFTDSLVEFAKRYEKELTEKKVVDSIPVLVMLSTTATEAASYEVPEINNAFKFLQARRSKVYVAMWSERQNVEGLSQLDTNRQSMLAIPIVKATQGKYEALAISNRLATLLPEWGEEIARMHIRHNNQVRVTVARKGATGPLQDPRVEITRPGLKGVVSLDGFLP